MLQQATTIPTGQKSKQAPLIFPQILIFLTDALEGVNNACNRLRQRWFYPYFMHKSKGIISASHTEEQFQIAQSLCLMTGIKEKFNSQRPNKTTFIACLMKCLTLHHKNSEKNVYGESKSLIMYEVCIKSGKTSKGS